MHQKTPSQLLKLLKTNLDGLPQSEIKLRQKQYGKNQITAKRRKPLIIQFLEEFKDLMVIILIIAAILAAIAGEKVDASVILFIVAVNALIGFVQKFKAEKALEALKNMIQPHAKVIRDGRKKIVDARELVPGDILILEEGDQVSADARLIEEIDLEANESTLTGESRPVKKTVDSMDKKNINLDERQNMLFMGTTITKGHGKAIIVNTGMNTMFGQIAHLTTSTKKDKSPLEKELLRTGVFVGKITLVISTILFLTGYFLQGEKFVDTLLFATSVAVAAVPEGLPATITIALALGVQRLAKKNAIVKQLSSVETLGSTTVICTDKTGTLTKNEMTVREIFIPNYNIQVHGVGYNPTGALHITGTNVKISLADAPDDTEDDFEDFNLKSLATNNLELHRNLELLSGAATLCNNSSLVEEKEKWKIIGDPTEGALLTASEKMGFEITKLNQRWKRKLEIPFNSERKMMSVICEAKLTKEAHVFTKGATTEVLKNCTHVLINGHVEELTAKLKKQVNDNNDRMAKKALRVLAFAYREMPKEKTYRRQGTETKMVFIGLMGMIDPPRPEVAKAVALTHQAGIKTYVITGDYGVTAEAIARQVGIVTGKNLRIVQGVELQTLSEPRLSKIIRDNDEIIFSRVSPEHKLKIVSVLKKHGEIVAMTGDGVNDAPALKRADIGVAMGISGTDVSKEASNMVLVDDSYGTIVTAIEEGRKIYQNLRKFVFYIFSCNIGELVTVFAAIILQMPPPLTAVLILCVDLGTDVLPALALGVDNADPDTMSNPPRNPKEKILKRDFVTHFVYLGLFIGAIVTTYFYVALHEKEVSYLEASTSAFVLLVFIQMWNAINARSAQHSIFKLGIFSNKYLLGAIAISVFTVFGMVEIPFIQNLIGTTHLSPLSWLSIIAVSSSVFIIEETRKLIFKLKKA